MTLRLGIPCGSLQAQTLELLGRAGLEVYASPRSYHARTSDPEIEVLLIRAQEMARYVEHGALDAGLTGLDWVLESGLDVTCVCELAYAKQSRGAVRWVLVPEDSALRRPEDLEGLIVATELVGVTQTYFEARGIDARVEFSWGATEIKPSELADAVVEIAETGSSLRANRLRIVDTVLESSTQLVANRVAWSDARTQRKLEDLALMLQGALAAKGRVGLMLNVRRADLPAVLELLPALNQPTLASLSDSAWVAINSVIDEAQAWELMPRLKAAKAEDIVEYPLSKVVS